MAFLRSFTILPGRKSVPVITFRNVNYAFKPKFFLLAKGAVSWHQENKDRSLLENLRPISLLNTDYKILAKPITKRLEKVLPKTINSHIKPVISKVISLAGMFFLRLSKSV